jgi:hypothetical protein
MVYHVFSANTVPGKDKAAEQFLLKVAAFVNQKFPGVNSHILRNFDGKSNRMHIVETWDSVGAWEVGDNQTQADPNWPILMQEALGLFDENSFERHFYQIVS